MTPLDVLWNEIKEIDPSFRVEYNAKTKKTIAICLSDALVDTEFEAESLSQVIIMAWLHFTRKYE